MKQCTSTALHRDESSAGHDLRHGEAEMHVGIESATVLASLIEIFTSLKQPLSEIKAHRIDPGTLANCSLCFAIYLSAYISWSNTKTLSEAGVTIKLILILQRLHGSCADNSCQPYRAPSSDVIQCSRIEDASHGPGKGKWLGQ